MLDAREGEMRHEDEGLVELGRGSRREGGRGILLEDGDGMAR